MVFENLPRLTIRPRAYSNVQPWTMEDGLTNQEILADIVRYIRDELIPFIREGLDNFVAEVVEELQGRLDKVIALIEEAQQLRDEVDAAASAAIAEITRIRDEAITEMIALRDAAEQYRDQAAVSAAAAGDAADAAEQISDAMQALYDEAQAILIDLRAELDTIAQRAQVVDFGLDGVPIDPRFARMRAGVESQATKTAVVSLGDSHVTPFLVKAGQDHIFRLALRAGMTSTAVPNLLDVTVAPSSGMRWYRGGVGGTRAADYLDTERAAKIALIKPEYVIHEVGSNDYKYATNVGAFETSYRAAVERAEAAAPNAIQVLVGQQNRYDDPAGDSWNAYLNRIKAIADESPTSRVYIDLPRFMAYDMGRTQRSGMFFDEGNIHLSATGHRRVADIMGKIMGIPSETDIPAIVHEMKWLDATGGGTFASMNSPAAAYPRWMHIEAVLYIRTNAGTSELAVNVDSELQHNYALPDGSNTIAYSYWHYQRPNKRETIGLAIRRLTGTAASVDGSGSKYQTFTITEVPA